MNTCTGYNYPGGQYLFNDSSGIRSKNQSLRGLLNYPIRVHISQSALSKLTANKLNNYYVDVKISCFLNTGTKIKLFLITNNFFTNYTNFRTSENDRYTVQKLEVWGNCFCQHPDSHRLHTLEDPMIKSNESVESFEAVLRLGKLTPKTMYHTMPSEVIPHEEFIFTTIKVNTQDNELYLKIDHFDSRWQLNLFQKKFDITTAEFAMSGLTISDKAEDAMET